jgi:hypothetical protein
MIESDRVREERVASSLSGNANKQGEGYPMTAEILSVHGGSIDD